MNDIQVTEVLEAGRVLWFAPGTEEVHRLLRDYHRNAEIGVLDFVRALRRTRRRMLDLRDGATLTATANGERNYLEYPHR